MPLASDSARDTVAEALAWFFGGFLRLFTDGLFALGVVAGLVLLFLVWRASLALGPKKVCWRCKGSGHVGGLFGGRRVCSHCDGGLQNRFGGGK